MTNQQDGTLASRGDNPTVEGRIVATLDVQRMTDRADFTVYADAQANALFEWAYWTRVADMAEQAAGRAWHRRDVLHSGGRS